MVTFIAGDAVRIWQLARRGYGRLISGSAIFLERALGLAVLMALVLVCVPVLLSHGAHGAVRTGLLVVAALCATGMGGFVASAFLGRFVARVAPCFHVSRITAAVVDVTSAARHLAGSWKLTTGVILLSAVMHLCNAFVFYILGRAAGVDIDLVTTVVITMPVMLIALMPIAVAGWGIREGSAIVGYGLFGVPPETALTISVAFGLALLLASLPGGVYLWLGRRIDRQVSVPGDGERFSA